MRDVKLTNLTLEVHEPPRLELPLGRRFDKSLYAQPARKVTTTNARLYLQTRSEP